VRVYVDLQRRRVSDVSGLESDPDQNLVFLYLHFVDGDTGILDPRSSGCQKSIFRSRGLITGGISLPTRLVETPGGEDRSETCRYCYETFSRFALRQLNRSAVAVLMLTGMSIIGEGECMARRSSPDCQWH
jgi:hypothetical protein